MDLNITSAPEGYSKDETKKETKRLLPALDQSFQRLLRKKEHSVLIILQGMDASGKDGSIKNVFARLDSGYCSVMAFNVPDETEKAHDFLWRIHPYTPGKGQMQVFNRSYYEDILVPEVHGTLSEELIKRRYAYINTFENMLADHGTIIIKFFLNISRDEQESRFKARLENPEKRWKYNPQDIKESALWNKYMAVYRKLFRKCSEAPWITVPSDQKWFRDFYIVTTLIEKLKQVN